MGGLGSGLLALPTWAVVACVAASSAVAQGARIDDAHVAIFTDVSVVDVVRGRVVPHRTVTVRGTRVVRIDPSGRTVSRRDAEVIPANGAYLVPGLWDMHVHAWDAALFDSAFVVNGITGVRDMGTGIGPVFGGAKSGVWAFRDATRRGEIFGPTVVAPGFILNGGRAGTQYPGGFIKTVLSPREGEEWVDSLARAGASFVKVYSALDYPTFVAIAERAREHGLPVAGHVSPHVGVRLAVLNGMRSIEHFYDLLTSTSREERALRAVLERPLASDEHPGSAMQLREIALADTLAATHSRERTRALAALLVRHHVWLDPTFIVESDPRCPGSKRPLRDTLANPGGLMGRFTAFAPRDSDFVRRCEWSAASGAVVRELVRLGVPMLGGTDSPNPGVIPGTSLGGELALMVAHGFSTATALRSVTYEPARFFGATDTLGSIAIGKRADLVLLRRNPLADIHAVREVIGVMIGGRYCSIDAVRMRRSAACSVRDPSPPPPHPVDAGRARSP